ncbi:DUF2971 domain-containing protein [Dyella acidisoli]|uniref:DUF2971 domain-containing protein n=1 Tax=Dyella acidisoli TaxID=1867834 RepID=A0ABQ5XIS9_9GAMM|nr:DUF2971 domain-containing protein [Dyella acidisoli]GLQ91610.1 hypothetical protein GCM10007901_05600 [Dyella acidisoli]
MGLFYHYCVPSTFHSIVSGRSLWLSSLSMSNDSMEGKLVSNIVSTLAKDDKVEAKVLEEIKTIVGFYEYVADGFGICLSVEGDLLSQWRGYAGDATGFSIGFNGLYLAQLAEQQKDANIVVQRVIYDKQQQVDLVKPLYETIKKRVESGPLGEQDETSAEATESFGQALAYEEKLNKARVNLIQRFGPTIPPSLFAMKSSAFAEEKEWRVISLGVALGNCSFRVSGNKIVPYRSLALDDLTQPAIVKVILGPKNPTPKRVVERFLENNGFKDVRVEQSTLTYR